MNGEVEIHRIPVGPFTNSFFVKGKRGGVLVDSGFPNQEKHLFQEIRRQGIRLCDIRLMVMTHGHADHVGSLHALKIQITAPVAVHQADRDLVRHGRVVIPPPITTRGRVLSLVLRAFSPLGRFKPFEPNVVIETDFPLETFGIRGTIIPTPGHTAGSMSVVLENGEALVGDLAVNTLPLGMGLGIPAIAEDVQQIYSSWDRLLSAGVTTIYPGHGKPFSAEKLRKKLWAHKRSAVMESD
jgi:glyoxylase-like metal-dependent hydrolase (beta-lactamase superfamily II)